MNRSQMLPLLAALVVAACSATPDAGTSDVGAPPAAGTLVNPIAYDAASIARGQALFRGNCVDCHNMDGRAINNDVAPGAADLTDPSGWKSDGSDGATFLVIRDGAGDAGQMPSFQDFLNDEDIWYIVNYLKSIRRQP